MPWIFIPLTAIMMVFGLPMVYILVKHQQKMATIIHGGEQNRNAITPEIHALRSEVQELRQAVHQLTIQMDDVAGIHRTKPPVAPADVRERLQAQ